MGLFHHHSSISPVRKLTLSKPSRTHISLPALQAFFTSCSEPRSEPFQHPVCASLRHLAPPGFPRSPHLVSPPTPAPHLLASFLWSVDLVLLATAPLCLCFLAECSLCLLFQFSCLPPGRAQESPNQVPLPCPLISWNLCLP